MNRGKIKKVVQLWGKMDHDISITSTKLQSHNFYHLCLEIKNNDFVAFNIKPNLEYPLVAHYRSLQLLIIPIINVTILATKTN
jgi:hypothetical protein